MMELALDISPIHSMMVGLNTRIPCPANIIGIDSDIGIDSMWLDVVDNGPLII